MRACPWLLLAFVTPLVLGLAGCSSETGSSGGAGGGGSGTTTADGGSGGAATTTTTTTAAPLTCSVAVSDPALSGECDLLQQNCPVGETCMAGPNATFCQKGGGLLGAGKSCNLDNGNKECQAGLDCIGSVGVGFCTRPCCKDNNEPCGGGKCILGATVNGVTVDMCYYGQSCTLFTESTCPEGYQCQILFDGKEAFQLCTIRSDMPALEGETCSAVNQCGDAQVCSNGKCRYSCKIGIGGQPGAGGCLAGQSCQGIYPNLSEIGVCQP